MRLHRSLVVLIALTGVAYGQRVAPTRAPFGVRVTGTRALKQIEKTRFTKSLATDKTSLVRNMTPAMRRALEREPGGFDHNVDRALKQMILGMPTSKSSGDATVIVRGRYISKYLKQGPVPGSFGAESVSWAVTPEDLKNDFARPGSDAWGAETDVPSDWPTISREQWKGLFHEVATSNEDQDGLSAGHMADSGSSKLSKADQRSTYKYMSNAFPQWYDNNTGAWHTLERDTRELVQRGYHVYNHAGPIWTPHTYTKLDGERVTVEARVMRDKIPVPTAFWKISIAVPPGADIGDAFAEARVFAVIVPNNKDAGILASAWTRFATTGAAIEKVTGLRFFSHVPDDIRRAWLDHKDQREAFDFKIEIPTYKEKALRNIARLGGTKQDVAAAQELLRSGRLTGGKTRGETKPEANALARVREQLGASQGSTR